MKKNKKIVSYILLFIESIVFLAITSLLVLKLTVFKESYIKRELNKNNYYEELKDEIQTEMSYYTNQSGFEDEILENTFTLGEVKYETNKFIENTYKGKSRNIDTSKLEERLNNNIQEYIKKNNFEKVDKKEIKDFTNAMKEVYQEEIKLMGYAEKIAPSLSKLINILNNAFVVLIVLFVLLILVNNILLKNHEVGVIFYTSSFLLIFTTIFIKNNIDIKNIFIYSKLFSNVIKSIINNLFNITTIIIVVYLILGLLSSLLRRTR